MPFRHEKTRKWRAQISANGIKIRTTDSNPLANNGNVIPISFSTERAGPYRTRRRNSAGLAELWGGWPIEQEAAQEDSSMVH